jgi:hypothetical protein
MSDWKPSGANSTMKSLSLLLLPKPPDFIPRPSNLIEAADK